MSNVATDTATKTTMTTTSEMSATLRRALSGMMMLATLLLTLATAGLAQRYSEREIRDIGQRNGYQYGAREARQDRRNNDNFDFKRNRVYRDGLVGYRDQYIHDDDYRDGFRRGFEQGYRDTYYNNRDNNSSYNNGSRRNNDDYWDDDDSRYNRNGRSNNGRWGNGGNGRWGDNNGRNSNSHYDNGRYGDGHYDNDGCDVSDSRNGRNNRRRF